MQTSESKSIFSPFKPLQVCANYFMYLPSLLSRVSLEGVKRKVLWNLLLSHVNQGLRIGRAASLAHLNNARHLTGDVFLALSVLAFFLRYFFSPLEDDRSWYYTGWFFFFGTLRPWMIGAFGTLATLYYWPRKNKSVYIAFTVLHSLCLLGVIHFSFLVYDYNSFHSYPNWSFWVLALSVGSGFVLASDHLVYVFEHKIKGNHKRWVMLEEHKEKLDAETRQRMLSDNLNEYRRMYTHY